MPNDNPLLDFASPTPHWERIDPAHLEPAVDTVLADNRALIAQLLQQENHDWDSLVAPLEAADNRLHRAFGAGSHLHNVHNSEAWRAAYEACLPKLTEYGSEIGQNAALCAAYRQVAAQPGLDATQRKLLADVLRDFRLAGVELGEADKTRHREIQQRLATLSNQFERQLLDATDAYQCHIDEPQRLAGLPDSALARAAEKARDKGLDGWLFGLDFPSFDAILTYAEDRSLREQLYRAYTTRASEIEDAGRDNGPVMAEILALRAEEAQLLGFDNYAELSLATKMAESPAQVEDFLQELAAKARPAAERELAELQALAAAQGGPATLASWDLAHYAEKLKQQRFGLEDEALRPYFALPRVLDGLFAAAQRLFGVQFATDPSLPTWHNDVLAFEVRDGEHECIARFYLDPCAREKKRGGAWMDDAAGRLRSAAGLQLPVATLTCNFAPALAGQPVLLTHDEVVTLFHEFGHGLQHMLTRVDHLGVSGINGVPWDAVELPSQFMENWCWEPEALTAFARHYETDEPIRPEWIEQIRASRVFQAGLATLRQVEFALFDLRLHGDGAADVRQTLAQVRAEVSILQPPEWNRFPNSFAHIFGGGYAAGYYSYKWAEVLAADAFGAFRENGIFDAATGERFRQCILEPGGSEEAMELFRRFRGREPQVEALLRQEGLLEDAA